MSWSNVKTVSYIELVILFSIWHRLMSFSQKSKLPYRAPISSPRPHIKVPRHTIWELLSYRMGLVPVAVQITVLCLEMASSVGAMPSDLFGVTSSAIARLLSLQITPGIVPRRVSANEFTSNFLATTPRLVWTKFLHRHLPYLSEKPNTKLNPLKK